jgi:hypothetical protein
MDQDKQRDVAAKGGHAAARELRQRPRAGGRSRKKGVQAQAHEANVEGGQDSHQNR